MTGEMKMSKQEWEKMMVEVEKVNATLDFSKMTNEKLIQEFGYWRKITEHRMKVFVNCQNTDLENRIYKDWQVADYNAQAAYLEMNERGLSYTD